MRFWLEDANRLFSVRLAKYTPHCGVKLVLLGRTKLANRLKYMFD